MIQRIHVCSHVSCDQAQNVLPHNIVKPVDGIAPGPIFCMGRDPVEKRRI